MSEPQRLSQADVEAQGSRKATIVKVIRGSEPSAVSSAPPKPAAASQPKPTPQPQSETEELKSVANQSRRKKFQDFTEHNSRAEPASPDVKRLARGPYFPLATSLRIASFFYVVGRLSIVATIASLIWLALDEQQNYLIAAPALICAIVFTFIAWGMSNGLRCRVCTMPFLSKRKCKMHSKAPKLPLVSHHFTVALHILTHNHPRCPYCGTTNRLKQ